LLAISEVELKGKKIEINKHEKKDKRESIGGATKFNNLFVKNLPIGTDDAGLKLMFQEFGEIDSASV
jgi:RNA recognition motif-containing protein